MRLMSKVLIGGIATAALAGTAVAAEHAVHVMNIAMPDGGTARVRYVGDTPPQVRFVPMVQAVPVAMIDPSFATMDRMFADMDAQADSMMRQAAMLSQQAPAAGAPLHQADMKTVPGGTVSYSYVSTTSSNGCTQTVRMTSNGSSQQPKVIRTSAGQCDSARAMPAVANGSTPAKAIDAVDTRPAAKPADPDTI